MKRWLIVILAVMSATAVFAGGLRLGAELSAEFMDRPSFTGVTQEFDEGTNLIPGLYWEYAGSKFGLGMTYLLDLEKVDETIPSPHEQRWLDWMTTVDARYHIFGADTFLDPFVEAGFGAAGRSNITNYEELGLGSNDYKPTNLSLFGQVGGGLALKLSMFHLGAKADWRFWNGAVPGTAYDAYPLKNFSVALFGGLAF